MNDHDGVDGVRATVAHRVKRLLRGLRNWTATKTAGTGPEVKRQVIRGVVGLVIFYFRTRI